MKYDDSNRGSATPRRSAWWGVLAAVAIAALVGLGTWLATSLMRSSDSVTVETSEFSPAQHTEQLVRVLRISAASDITPAQDQTIPEAVVDNDPVTCGSRYAAALDQATIRLHGIDYLSTVAGARTVDTPVWRTQQAEAHDSALALHRLFPQECEPVVPVVFDVPNSLHQAEGIGIQHMLRFSDELVEEWSELYLLAETAEQRELAYAGLWQVIRWESNWQSGRSPFTFSD